jgi:hypothetical protein
VLLTCAVRAQLHMGPRAQYHTLGHCQTGVRLLWSRDEACCAVPIAQCAASRFHKLCFHSSTNGFSLCVLCAACSGKVDEGNPCLLLPLPLALVPPCSRCHAAAHTCCLNTGVMVCVPVQPEVGGGGWFSLRRLASWACCRRLRVAVAHGVCIYAALSGFPGKQACPLLLAVLGGELQVICIFWRP